MFKFKGIHVMKREEHTLRKVIEDGYTGKKEDRMTENMMERHVPRRQEKYRTENGRGDGV